MNEHPQYRYCLAKCHDHLQLALLGWMDLANNKYGMLSTPSTNHKERAQFRREMEIARTNTIHNLEQAQIQLDSVKHHWPQNAITTTTMDVMEMARGLKDEQFFKTIGLAICTSAITRLTFFSRTLCHKLKDSPPNNSVA